MYRYKSSYLPLGVFSSLIIAIICKQNPKWTLKEDNPCRNKIEFLVKDDYDTVTIINCVYFIKVILFRECDPTTPTCDQCTHIEVLLICLWKLIKTSNIPMPEFSMVLSVYMTCPMRVHFIYAN